MSEQKRAFHEIEKPPVQVQAASAGGGAVASRVLVGRWSAARGGSSTIH